MSPPPRTLTNPTETACHLGSAILLLYHCLSPAVDHFVSSVEENVRDADAFPYALACLFRELQTQGDKSAVDPALVYRHVPKAIGVQPTLLGDAVTALCKLLQYFRETHDMMWKKWIDTGRVHSILEGVSGANERKRKVTPQKAMSVPLTVPVKDDDTASLLDLLRDLLQPKRVDGYKWSSNGSDLSFETYKTLCIDAFPPVWMIHVDRFQWNNEERTERSSRRILEIPQVFSAKEFLTLSERQDTTTNDETLYHLVGGILHAVSEESSEDSYENLGHYICLVHDPEERDKWLLLDDDQEAQILTETEALKLFAGSYHTSDKEGEQFMQGVLTMYHRTDVRNQLSRAECTFHPASDEKTSSVDWLRPNLLVGLRLRVQWAKGKWYAGVVSNYDCSTGKHEVTYDDGDIRWYQNLRKKTIEWNL